MILDNPAARLLDILTAGRGISSNFNCKLAWHNLLHVDQSDSALLLKRLGKVYELPERAVHLLREHFPEHQESVNYWRDHVNNAFNHQVLQQTWQSFIEHIDAHTIGYLKFSASLIRSIRPGQEIPLETLEQVKSQFRDILDEVLASDFPIDIKTYLVRSLQKILVEIDEYFITGTAPILDSIDSTLGHAFRAPGYGKLLGESTIGRKLFDAISFTSSVITIDSAMPAIAATFTNFLSFLG